MGRRNKPKTVDNCFACGLRRPCEKDHVVPIRSGGEDKLVIPLCISCHDAKDRMSFDSWDVNEYLEGVQEMLKVLGPKGRLVLLKMFVLVCEALDQLHDRPEIRRKR